MFNISASSLCVRSLVLAPIACVLVACGGGGGGGDVGGAPVITPPANNVVALDKYVGSWTRNCQASSATSSNRETLSLNKTGTTTLSLIDSVSTYTLNNTCAGTPTNSQTDTGTITFVGQKQIGASTVDKMTLEIAARAPNPAVTRKQVFLVDGNSMKDGNISSTPDAEGFPSVLSTSTFTK